MKFCLSNRQRREYLSKAQEIKMEYRDYNSIPDLFEHYPGIPVIVQIPYQDDIDWETIEKFKRMRPTDLICCVSSRAQAELCRDLGIRFYYGFPISTYYEMRQWLAMGVCYVRLDAPLFFDLPTVAQTIGETPIRAIPNVSYEEKWNDDGVCGPWIRPEDLELYENYISVVEFEDCDVQKEQALYRIYAEQKKWPGPVRDLITNVDTNAMNRLISPKFGERRIRCKQKCQANSNCHFCSLALKLADYDFIKTYKEEMEKKNDSNFN